MRLLLLCPLVLAACAHTQPSAKPFTTPDGRAAMIAYCGGAYHDMTSCHAMARTTCGGNYTVINEFRSQRQYDGGSTENRELTFACSPAA